MASIEGTIRIGEATKAVWRISKRQVNGTFWQYAVLVFCIGCGVLGGWLSERWVHNDGGLPNWFFGVAVGCAVSVFALRRMSVAQLRAKLTKGGTPLDMPARLEIGAEGLHYVIADLDTRAPWKAVSDLFHAKGYWIFLVQSQPWFAPDRLFANEEAKREFIAEALSYMSEEARARSKDAVKFVQSA